MLKITGIILLIISLALAVFVFYRNNPRSSEPIIFSPREILGGTWHAYKLNYIEASTGRTADFSKGNISTSEAESYAMLRSVWWDDQNTFNQSWSWTQKFLQHKNDHLFSWLYGQEPGGSYGVLTAQSGQNSASDADEDIALALLFASKRWGNVAYENDARAIIQDIWSKEVAVIRGQPYLLANNIEKTSGKQDYIMDPSYFAPYEYRIFAKIDPADNWNGLVDTSYQVLENSAKMNLGYGSSDGLPPDWILINKNTGALVRAQNQSLDSNYGYDALRIPFRLALDWSWFKDPRDKQVLAGFSFLNGQWQANHSLYADYAHDGSVVQTQEIPAMYGGAIAYFMLEHPNEAKQVYASKLASLYNPDTLSWASTLSYYDDNWAWFGIGLYNNYLINLYGAGSSAGSSSGSS